MTYALAAICLLGNAFLMFASWQAIDRAVSQSESKEASLSGLCLREVFKTVVFKATLLAFITIPIMTYIDRPAASLSEQLPSVLALVFIGGPLSGALMGAFAGMAAAVGAKSSSLFAKLLVGLVFFIGGIGPLLQPH